LYQGSPRLRETAEEHRTPRNEGPYLLATGRPTILHIIPSLRQGGAQRILSSIVTQQTDSYRHHVVTLLDEKPFFAIGDIDLTAIGMDRSGLDISAVGRLVRTVDQARPVLIHAWMYHANFLSTLLRRHNRPILWSIHNTDLSSAGTRVRTRLVNRAGVVLSHVVPSLILYCSRSARNIHEAIGYAKGKGRIIENGVATALIFPDDGLRRTCRRELGLADSDFVVCSLGRFAPQKDHATLIEAMARARATVPQMRGLLVGSGCGPENSALSNALHGSGLRETVQTLGERRDINAILNASDLLVMSSAFGEAMPLAILEAAAVGLPIVSTAAGNVAELELVDEVVPTSDPARLAAAIGAAASRPRSAEAAAAKRRLVEGRFSIDRMLSSYVETYCMVLTSTAGPASGYA
jgi:glycosyltransferase involved in cell wall biosynthesis